MTATRSEDGKTLVLKVVNLGPQPRKTTLRIARFQKVSPTAEIWTLTGRLEERNSPTEPNRIRSQQTKFTGAAETFAYEFPAHSYTILRLRGQTTEGE